MMGTLKALSMYTTVHGPPGRLRTPHMFQSWPTGKVADRGAQDVAMREIEERMDRSQKGVAELIRKQDTIVHAGLERVSESRFPCARPVLLGIDDSFQTCV